MNRRFALALWLLGTIGCGGATTPGAAGSGGAQNTGSGGSPTTGSGGNGAGDAATTGSGGSGAGGAAIDASSLPPPDAPDAGGGATGGASGAALPLPTHDEFARTLTSLVDLLLSTQLTQPGQANYGALVSPSTNPDNHPLHNRAAEAVYPIAVVYKRTQDAKYADAAIRLGNWLVSIQPPSGAWIEEWPATTGWDGTTADQLISLAGALVLLKPRITDADSARWIAAITRSADWVTANFPRGNNINYTPTGAVALLLATRAVPTPKAAWMTKAQSLMASTLQAINSDGLLSGEGGGVDLGYNIAQSIGFIAAWGRMMASPMHVDRATQLMLTHLAFMYPNGAIDNSWGTRTYKWMFESGTKTAPGVLLGLGLLAEQSPVIQRAAQLALDFLRTRARDAQGWIAYGPSASQHATSSPPSNYSTFARAQALAMAIELGPEATTTPTQIDAEKKNWSRYFPTVSTGLVRTEQVMATLSAYGAISTYPRGTVVRGGSVSALWFEGYGPTGFLQVSSQTDYTRVEALHMPIEGSLLPLTARIETTGGTLASNLYDDKATLSVKTTATGAEATASGVLRTGAGAATGTTFTWAYQFAARSYSKQVTVSTVAGVRIVEPFVDVAGNQYELKGADTFQITTAAGGVWTVKVDSASGAYQLTAGTERARYWCPFPGVDAYPLVITPGAGATAPFTIKYTISKG